MSGGGFGNAIGGMADAVGGFFGGGASPAPTDYSSAMGSLFGGGGGGFSDLGGFSGSAASPSYFGGASDFGSSLAGGASSAFGGGMSSSYPSFGSDLGFSGAASSLPDLGFGSQGASSAANFGLGGNDMFQSAANTALAGQSANATDGLMSTLKSYLPSAGQAQLGLAGLGMYNNYKTQKAMQPAINAMNQAAPNAINGMLSNAQAASGYANPILANGGQLTASQSANIDSQMQQLLQQGTSQIYQNAVNAGLDPNSLMVQQQIQQLQTNINTQKNALTQQYQQQNLSTAMQSLGLSGSSYGALLNPNSAQAQQAAQTGSSIAQTIAQLNAMGNASTSAQNDQAQANGS